MHVIARVLLSFLVLTAGIGIPPAHDMGIAYAAAAPADLKSSHPRLLADDAKFAQLRSLVTTDDVAAAWYAQIKAAADVTLGEGAATYDLSSGNLLTTSRTVLERVYRLGFMWQVTRDSTYAERAWVELNAAASFPTWNPTHFLDTAEMSHAFAIGYDWLFEYWTESQRSTLRSAVTRLAFTPAIAAYDSASFWVTDTGNWNTVCNSGLAIAALAFADGTADNAAAVLARAQTSLKASLTSYSPDGGFKEGITYWAYATSYLVTYTSVLLSATGSDQGLLQTPGLSNTGTFAVSLSGPSGNAANTGDAWSNEKLTTPLLGLRKLYADDRLSSRAITGSTGPQSDEVTPRGLIWYYPDAKSSAPTSIPKDSVFSSADIAAVRSSWSDSDATFATLRGSRGPLTGHSDLDAGQFSLDALGVNWAVDLGADSYALPGYFTPNADNRWQFYRKRPEGQNRLVFNPKSTPDSDWNVSPTLSVVQSNPDSGRVISDLTSSSSGHVTSWKRGVSLFDGRSQVLVQDEVKASHANDVWWFMHTKSDINVASDGLSAVLTQDGEQMVARLISPSGARFSYMDAKPLKSSPAPSGQAPNLDTHKLAVHLSNAQNFSLAVQFTPVRRGSPIPPATEVQALSTWGTSPGPAPTVTGLSLAGLPVAGFSPSTLTYDVDASTLSTPPSLLASASAGASVQVTQATAVPGRAVAVVSEPGKLPRTYSVYFHSGAIPIASVSSSTESASNPSLNTIDGRPYSVWKSKGNQWLQYDLGRTTTVSHIEVNWDQMLAAGSKYEVHVSTNMSTWTKSYAGVVKATKLMHWASFQTGPILARYVKILSLGDGTPAFPTAINEVKIYSDNLPHVLTYAKTPHYSVAFDSGDMKLEVGAKATLPYMVTGLDGQVRPGTGYPGLYESSAPSIASVNSAGDITAIKPGRTQVSISIPTNNNQELYTSATIDVSDNTIMTVPSSGTTYVQGGSLKNANLSTAWQLFVRHNDAYPDFDRYAYMSFDLSQFSQATIQSAKLYFTAAVADPGGNQIDVNAHAVIQPWSPNAVTFSTRPSMDYRAGTTSVDNTTRLREMDVTDFARREAGAPASLAFTEDNPPNGLGLVVSIGSHLSPNKPYLVIQKRTGTIPTVPVITRALSSTNTVPGAIDGTVLGAAHTVLGVDLYASAAKDCIPVRPAGTLVGSATLTTDATGVGTFHVNGTVPVGSSVFGVTKIGPDTSQTSNCVKTTLAAGTVVSVTVDPSSEVASLRVV
ncbi:hypothetical protein RCH16_002308 [Cryobacterium sp. MP_M5]|uniref:CBM96 family carbohydrate-binding protein n=1 Tax=unclassified Cryobacterium TaxID=2649013 RepID=UPI0018CBD42A|nr:MULTISPECIES: DNRLRE domain-containing protein [unclassified Cryobacterium]MBG6058659.1 hypothetical protein [Cryobacterium sp. MP_M3]MEC5177297.1 hypothetical protein [Cryobacterium sp. MP_M5]